MGDVTALERAAVFDRDWQRKAKEEPKVRGLASLLSMNCPEQRPMMGSWLMERHLVLLYAPSGIGKSFLAMSIALAVAGQGSIDGLGRAEGARKVLYLDGEMDLPDLQKRARQLLGQISGIDREKAAVNLKFLARMDQEPEVKFPDLAEEEGRSAVLALAEKSGAGLVVLDNLSTLASIQEENDSASFNPIIKMLVELKQRGRSVIVVHHSRKNSGGEGAYRGSQKLSVIFNSILRLEKPELAAKFAFFKLHWEKFRELRDDSTNAPLSMQLGEDGWKAEVDEDARMARLVAELRTLRHTSVRSAAEAAGIPSSTAGRLKDKAIALKRMSAAELKEWLEAARELQQPLAEEELEF